MDTQGDIRVLYRQTYREESHIKERSFDIKALRGLSERQAADRLREEGYNELPSAKRRGIAVIAFEIVRQPIFLLLAAAGLIYLMLGDRGEALMLLGFVAVVIGITLYQERKTERALESLRDLSSPRARVIREGLQKRIAGREVVRDDLLVLSEGDRVPADAVLLSAHDLRADESLLTGESIPVRKVAWDGVMEMSRPGGDDLPFVYSGTLLVQGQGIARVRAIGVRTEIGKIGKKLEAVEPEETPLQKETGRLVRNLAFVGLSLCGLVVVLYGLTKGNWLNGFLAGITLAMALLPEEFPVVLTVFLAIGAWRIAQSRVLTRRVTAVEALGAATVLCVDKTGTLTQNRMTVRRIFSKGELCEIVESPGPLPETFHEILEFSILASEIDPMDPMEMAFRELGDHSLARTGHLHRDWALVQEYSLTSELLALSHVWKAPGRDEYIIAAKGSPEAIADLCHFDPAQREALSRQVGPMADDGLRVLGVAKAYFKGTVWPGRQHDFEFSFLGLIGLADPIRPSVPSAVKECHTAGIRVIMITGDYPGTARAIARQIALEANDGIITGDELERMGESELRERIKTVNVFARVLPEQKLRLVEAFKANGEVVAMTGDGVNDAPALKSAHIGIAMGGRGTDVAREASALVLLEDDFGSIVQAVKLGRRIFDNLQKAMAYILAIHVPIAGLSLIPLMAGWPLVFFPVHIMFLELIIDPACSIVFEATPEEADLMSRPPRNPAGPLFGRRIVGLSLLQGVIVLLITLAVYGVALYRGQGEWEARALTFTTLVIANLGLIFTNRSWSRTIPETLRSPNPALWWVVWGALVFLGLVLYLPFLRDRFNFGSLHPIDLAIGLAAGASGILWFEMLKLLNGWRKRMRD
ncbi:MAG: cation-translocating P-type ATPase [Nitrospirae bacterium]|nr:cation-translocating P-type ATPase [Nitrospirota bacterium]